MEQENGKLTLCVIPEQSALVQSVTDALLDVNRNSCLEISISKLPIACLYGQKDVRCRYAQGALFVWTMHQDHGEILVSFAFRTVT